MTNYLEMQPGTIWMQKKNGPNSSTIIVKVEVAPYCCIQPSYGERKPGYPITEPPYEGAPVVKMITYNRYPVFVYRYLICDDRHINKRSEVHANGFTSYYTRIH